MKRIALLGLALFLLAACQRGAGLTEPARIPPLTHAPYADTATYDYTPQVNADEGKGYLKKRLAVARLEDNLALEQSPFGHVIQERDGSLRLLRNQLKTASGEQEEIRLAPGSRELLAPEGGWVNRQFQEMLVNELQRTNRFTIVERQEINALLRELKFGESKWVSRQNSEKAGNLLGAQLIVSGSFAWNSDRDSFREGPLALYLRLYEVGTGRVIAAEKAVGQGVAEMIQSAVMRLAAQAEKIPWSARVASVKGEYLYINDGLGSNLSAGDHLSIFSLGAPILDPADRQTLLGYEEEKCGEGEVVSVEPRLSKVRLRAPAKGVKVGDLVKFAR